MSKPIFEQPAGYLFRADGVQMSLDWRTNFGAEKTAALQKVTTDVGGAAGSKATFACDVKAIGTPDEFDYNPATQSAAPAKAVKG